MNISYLNFDLLLEKGEDGYWVRVIDSPFGQTLTGFNLPFQKKKLDQFLALVAEPIANDASRISAKEAAIKEFGGTLFTALFKNDVYTTYVTSLNLAFQDRKRLRIRLRMSEVPELARLPWEFLYDASRDEFLSLSIHTPIVRYIDLMHRVLPLAIEPPLRVLVVIASPAGLPALDVESEWLSLLDAVDFLGKEKRMIFERLQRPTLLELQRKLRQGEFHVLHFIGHGEFDDQAQEGILMFEDEQGRTRPVTGQHLGRLLADHFPLRLAVLNACKGARGGSQNPYAGVAQSLVKRGIPAVVAMQFEITDTAAITFAREFYSAVADRFSIDAAVGEVRKAILAAEEGIEWGTPVLFMRAPDGQLFATKDYDKEKGKEKEAGKQEGGTTPAAGGVNIDVGTGGSTISGSTITFGNVSGGSKEKK